MVYFNGLQVRNQSHSCLRDILLSFQRKAILVPASDGIARCFERLLLLAGGAHDANTGSATELLPSYHDVQAFQYHVKIFYNTVGSVLTN